MPNGHKCHAAQLIEPLVYAEALDNVPAGKRGLELCRVREAVQRRAQLYGCVERSGRIRTCWRLRYCSRLFPLSCLLTSALRVGFVLKTLGQSRGKPRSVETFAVAAALPLLSLSLSLLVEVSGGNKIIWFVEPAAERAEASR